MPPIFLPFRALLGAALAAVLLLSAACRRGEKFPVYTPHENLLSIAAEFQLLAPLNPYSDPVGRDLTGQSIARSTLVRVSNYEALHPGRLTPELLVLKARSLELLGDYASARRNYQEAATYDTELRADSERRAAILETLAAAAVSPAAGTDLPTYIAALGRQAADLRLLADAQPDPLYRALALVEAERVDVRRAELMAANRQVLTDGERQAMQALEKVVTDHRGSARALEHALRLAHYHRSLAEEEVRLYTPESLEFRGDYFRTHFEASRDLLYRISQADGRPERQVARHELDALLVWGEQVSRRMR